MSKEESGAVPDGTDGRTSLPPECNDPADQRRTAERRPVTSSDKVVAVDTAPALPIEALADFRTIFQGRTDAYGTDAGECVHRPPDWTGHLFGVRAIGLYPVRDDATTNWGVIDLDTDDRPLADQLMVGLEAVGLKPFLERSRGKGWHLWVFFDEPVPACRVRRLLRHITGKCGVPNLEVFPKQDRVAPGGVGNYINLPYFGGVALADGRRAVWRGDEVLTLEEFLGEAIEARMSAEDLNGALAACGLPLEEPIPARRELRVLSDADFLPCMVTAMTESVEKGNRDVTLFTAAKHCRRSGKTYDDAWEIIQGINESSEAPLPRRVAGQKLDSAYHGRGGSGYQSLGCEEPLWTEGRCVGKEHCPVHKVALAIRDYRPRDTWPYTVEDGRIILDQMRKGKLCKTPVCDFSALIVQEVESEEGGRTFRIEGTVAQGKDFRFDIGAESFVDEKQLKGALADAAGAGAIIAKGMAGHLAPAIGKLSEPVIVKRFQRTGWADGHFLLPGREPDGVEIRLPGKTAYSLDPRADLTEGLKALEALLNVQDPWLTTVAITPLLQAPVAFIADWRGERYGMFVEGLSGSLKTTWAQTGMAMYGLGFLKDENLVKWGHGGTHNAVMQLATHLHDMPFLIDNYKSNTGGGAKDFVNLMHAVLEGGEKLRLNRTAELQPSRPIFAWPVMTGEDVPTNDAASLARVLAVRFARQRAARNPHMDLAAAGARHLCAVGAAWLAWLESDAGQIAVRKWASRFPVYRTKWARVLAGLRTDTVNALRVASNLASNELTWKIMMDCPALADIARRYDKHHERGLHEVAASMANKTAETVEAAKYLAAIRSLLATGRCFLIDRKSSTDNPSEPGRTVVGYHDDKGGAYLLPEVVLKEVLTLLQHSGALNDLSPETLYKQLKEMSALGSMDNNRSTKTVKVKTRDTSTHTDTERAVRTLHITAKALGADDGAGWTSD